MGRTFIERNDRDPWTFRLGQCVIGRLSATAGLGTREFGNYGPVLMTSDPTRGKKVSKVAGKAWHLGETVSAESRRVTNLSWTRLLLPRSGLLPFIDDAKSRLTVSLSQDEASLTPDTWPGCLGNEVTP